MTPSFPPTRLLHVTRCEELGIRSFLRDLIANTSRERFDILVAAPLEGPLAADLRQMDVATVRLPMRRAMHPADDLASAWRLRRLLRRWRPDVVHLHGSKPGFLGRLLAPGAGVRRIIYTPNNQHLALPGSGLRRGIVSGLERLMAQRGIVVAVTEAEREMWIGRGLAPDRVAMIADAIDPASQPILMPREAARSRLGLRTEDFVALMVARLHPQKAPEVFVEAAAHFLRRDSHAVFLLAGEGELREQLQAQSHRLGVGERVRLLGFRDDLGCLLGAADAVVLTSRYEGLPIVLLQAMYAGLPVVISAVLGAEEVVTPECGFVVPILNAEATAGALHQLAANRARASQMGACGSARVRRHFGAAAMAQLYEILYGGGITTAATRALHTTN